MPASEIQINFHQFQDATKSRVPSFPTVNIKLSEDLSDILKKYCLRDRQALGWCLLALHGNQSPTSYVFIHLSYNL